MSDSEARRAAWDRVAEGYDGYFSPRFAPWLADAVGALAAGALPAGPVVVPCCGPGAELSLLARALPGRRIVGGDFSAGMVELARRRCAGEAGVEVVEADAQRAFWGEPAAAVVSAFGLQQLAGPLGVLRSWVSGLGAGGALSVVFWPPEQAPGDLFAQASEAMREQAEPGPRSPWFDELMAGLAGLPVRWLRRGEVAHGMEHGSAEELFDALYEAGPRAATAARVGAEAVARARAAFVGRAPRGRLRHEPRAFHLVAIKGSPAPAR